jgi:hypothetical protein
MLSSIKWTPAGPATKIFVIISCFPVRSKLSGPRSRAFGSQR